MNKLPSFIVIGTVKSGSTGIYKCLGQHPKIKLSKIKEVHFFDKDHLYKKGLDYYYSILGTCKKDEIIGEATPDYIEYPEKVAPRIKQTCPKVKLIVMLRNPVKRAYSYTCMHYRYIQNLSKENKLEFELPTFDEFVESILNQIKNPKNVAKTIYERGHYADRLKKWFKKFNRNQFIIIKSEDFFKEANKITNKVIKELGLPPFKIINKNPNKGSYPSSMSDKFKRTLKNYYKKYNRQLYNLLDRNFKWEEEL